MDSQKTSSEAVTTNVSGETPPPESKSKTFAIVAGILALLVLFGGGYYFYSNKEDTSTMKETAATSAPAQLLPYQEVQAMTEADYEKYLAQKITGFNEGGISGYAGPMLIKAVTPPEFAQGSLGIEAHMVPMPNIVAAARSFYSPARVKITSILDATGQELYDMDSSVSKKGQPFSLSYTGYPSPQLLGSRNGYDITPGKTFADVAEVRGEITLELPINTQKIALVLKSEGESVTSGAAFAMVKKLAADKVELTGEGDFVDTVRDGLVFYSEKGKKLFEHANAQSQNGKTTITYTFESPVHHAETLIFDKTVMRSYPFVLTHHAETAEVVVRQALSEDQKQMVQTLNDLNAMVSAKDSNGVFKYLRDSMSEGDRAGFDEKFGKASQSDKDQFVEYLEMLVTDIQTDLLDTGAATWTISGDAARVRLHIVEGSSESTRTRDFFKREGKWWLNLE